MRHILSSRSALLGLQTTYPEEGWDTGGERRILVTLRCVCICVLVPVGCVRVRTHISGLVQVCPVCGMCMLVCVQVCTLSADGGGEEWCVPCTQCADDFRSAQKSAGGAVRAPPPSLSVLFL